MSPGKRGLRQIASQTVVSYARMAATVMIAVVVRLCLDCVGLIITDQEPMQMGFWFAHCRTDGVCVFTALSLFLTALLGCSAFAWAFADWVTDPNRNPYARRYSFAIIVEAATWIPISVSVGKTNALVEWVMDTSKDDLVQALLSSAVAALLTISCALLTHVAMTHCRGVQQSATVKEDGLCGFFKFFLLTALYCLGWMVGWSNWELVLSLMDALEPGRSLHNAMLSAGVISSFLILSMCVYLKYGPEPIIPDPALQHICYNHGYSSSVRRSLLSYIVYSSVVFIVMCVCDPTYGLLMSILRKGVYMSDYEIFDGRALVVLCFLSCLVTLVAAGLSALITWSFEVDEFSSMKLSRSVHEACKEMVSHRRCTFDRVLSQVIEDGSDAHLAEAFGGQSHVSGADGAAGPPPRQDPPRVRHLSDGRDAASVAGWSPPVRSGVRRSCRPADAEAAGGALPPWRGSWSSFAASLPAFPYLSSEENEEQVVCRTSSGDSLEFERPRPRSRYLEMEVGPEPDEDVASERQLFLNPVHINASLCASVLAYDVLGFVVCFQWGAMALRFYSVLFGRIAGYHDALYILSCLLYAAVVSLALSRLIFSFFPSAEELACSATVWEDDADDPNRVAFIQVEEAARELKPTARGRSWWRRLRRLAVPELEESLVAHSGSPG